MTPLTEKLVGNIHYAGKKYEQEELALEAKSLLGLGADPNAHDFRDESLLHIAASEHRYAERIKLLIEAKADLESRINSGAAVQYEEFGNTPLIASVMHSNPSMKVIGALIEAGADIEAKNDLGNTSLLMAVRKAFSVKNYSDKIIKLLLDAGANPNVEGEFGWTPLHAAASLAEYNPSRSTSIVQHLLDSGANVNSNLARGDMGLSVGLTPLHLATDPEIVRMFISAGANLEAKLSKLQTPLHNAVSMGFVECVEELVKAGADIEAKDDHGWTPLHTAYHGGRKQVISFLQEAGANQNAKTTGDFAPDLTPAELGFTLGKKLK